MSRYSSDYDLNLVCNDICEEETLECLMACDQNDAECLSICIRAEVACAESKRKIDIKEFK